MRIKIRIFTHTHIHVCSLVFMSWLIVFLLLAALECVQKNLILVHRISAESTNELATKKPICEQRLEYAPTQDVSFMACTINKQVFSETFHLLYIHIISFNNSILVVLRYLSTCCSDSGLTCMQIKKF